MENEVCARCIRRTITIVTMNHHAGRKVTSEREHGSATAGRIECHSFKSCRRARTKTQNVVRYRGICQIPGGEHTDWKSTPLCPFIVSMKIIRRWQWNVRRVYGRTKVSDVVSYRRSERGDRFECDGPECPQRQRHQMEAITR